MATSRADQDGAACSSSSHSTPTHTVLQEKERQLPQLVQQLKQRMRDTQPLADEPQYFLQDDTLARFVRARDYNVKEAEKQLRYAVEWRRKNRPLNTVCRACRKKPGLHSIVSALAINLSPFCAFQFEWPVLLRRGKPRFCCFVLGILLHCNILHVSFVRGVCLCLGRFCPSVAYFLRCLLYFHAVYSILYYIYTHCAMY